jgi:hypothetical protein
LSALLLSAAAFDGEAALRHASALAALGPHPWGSPRAGAAAQYVAAQLRTAGLADVSLRPFEARGRRGANVVGVLAGGSPERVVVGAHHDTAPDAPGAYDDGGGVGVLIETARVLARGKPPARTLVFVSFDGEESWAAGGGDLEGQVVGSREYVRSLGAGARQVAAAFVIEMCGWKGGKPVLHPIAYTDPLQPETYVVTPAWLLGVVLRGARAADAPFRVGDPLLSWLYQPAVRTVRTRLYGDDMAFLQAGVPAVLAADSSFTAFYPWYHQAGDTADRLDAAALARMGRSVVGAVEALAAAPRGPGREPHAFVALGVVITAPWLYALGAASLLPRLARIARARGLPAGLLLQAALFGLLLWRHPVVAVWVFLWPNLLAGLGGVRAAVIALLPLLSLAALGLAAAARGMAAGLWLSYWELAVAAAALALLWVTAKNGRRAARMPGGSRGGGRAADRASSRRRALGGGRARGRAD